MTPLALTPATRPSLIARLRDPADQAGWAEFVSVYGPLVFGEVRRRGFHDADAEDLTQQIFTRVFRGMHTFRYSPERGRFRDWLGTIVKNEMNRVYRDRGRHPAALLPSQGFDAIAAESDPEWADAFQSHVLSVAMTRCRPQFEEPTWKAFEGVWVHNRAPQAIAAEAKQTVDWVYVAKSRVLKALAETIRDLTDDVPYY